MVLRQTFNWTLNFPRRGECEPSGQRDSFSRAFASASPWGIFAASNWRERPRQALPNTCFITSLLSFPNYEYMVKQFEREERVMTNRYNSLNKKPARQKQGMNFLLVNKGKVADRSQRNWRAKRECEPIPVRFSLLAPCFRTSDNNCK